jgi:hypothetical protein
MNTNALAKHYATLSLRERLPLIMAASRRGDEVERERLATSAPKVGWSVPDYFGLSMAFAEVSNLHLMELLDLAAVYFRALGLADSHSLSEEQRERMNDAALMFGYLLKVNLAGWRQFCAENGFDPDLCWSCLPGFEPVRRAEGEAGRVAFTAGGALRYGQGKGGGKEPERDQLTSGSLSATGGRLLARSTAGVTLPISGTGDPTRLATKCIVRPACDFSKIWYCIPVPIMVACPGDKGHLG